MKVLPAVMMCTYILDLSSAGLSPVVSASASAAISAVKGFVKVLSFTFVPQSWSSKSLRTPLAMLTEPETLDIVFVAGED